MNHKLKRVLFYPLLWKCGWHKGDWPRTYDPDPQNELCLALCPDCGCLLDTKTCDRCGKSFLDFEAKGFDDIMGAPAVTESGDLMCIRCAKRWQEEEDEEYRQHDYDLPDDHDTYEEMMADGEAN